MHDNQQMLHHMKLAHILQKWPTELQNDISPCTLQMQMEDTRAPISVSEKRSQQWILQCTAKGCMTIQKSRMQKKKGIT